MADRLIRITTALAVAAVAAVAAVISYRHAYELVTTHGETGLTARLLPFTVDGLILAASMLILDASRRHHPVPPLARWCLGAGIAATIGANLAHGLGHGPDRRTGQRLARPGPGRLLRTPHDPHPNRTTRHRRQPSLRVMRTRLRRQRCTMHHPCQLARQRWSRRYGPGTAQAAASAPSPATSASTAARSNASSTTPPDPLPTNERPPTTWHACYRAQSALCYLMVTDLGYSSPVEKPDQPIQSDVPSPGLTPLELAQDLLSRIDRGNTYARSKKKRFRTSSSATRLGSLLLSVTSTIILGLQDLDGWTGVAFALVAVVTTVNTLEPFFAWRSRWILMEKTQYRFYRLRDDLTYYIASNKPDRLEESTIRQFFDSYQRTWDLLSDRWMEYSGRRGPGLITSALRRAGGLSYTIEGSPSNCDLDFKAADMPKAPWSRDL